MFFATEGSRYPPGAPPELLEALDLHRFGGPTRLTWTEYQAADEYVLDLHRVVAEAASSVESRRGAGEADG